MDPNFEMNVDDRAKVGVGQASDAVAPISASSLFNAAEAANSVEAGNLSLSMPGGISASAPSKSGGGMYGLPFKYENWSNESAVDQIRKAQLKLAYERIFAEGRPGSKVVYDEGYTYGVTSVVQSKSMSWDSVSVDSRVYVNGKEEADSDDPTVLEALGVPKTPEIKDYGHDEMLEVLSDIAQIDTTNIYDLIDGEDDGTIQCEISGINTKQLEIDIRAQVYVRFQGRLLMPMTSIDLCNFLVALHNDGEEVALAVLHHIYSGENEE